MGDVRLAAISAEIEIPAPPPDAPGLFDCAAPDAIGHLFRDAGTHDVVETEVHDFLEPASAEEYCTYITEVVDPLRKLLNKSRT